MLYFKTYVAKVSWSAPLIFYLQYAFDWCVCHKFDETTF